MVDIDRLKRAVEVQKEKIIEKIIEKSENDVEISEEELDMLENFLDSKKEEE